jgi:integrase
MLVTDDDSPGVRRHGQVTTPKGGRLRYVPLTIRLAAAFRDHRHLRNPNVLCQDGANR